MRQSDMTGVVARCAVAGALAVGLALSAVVPVLAQGRQTGTLRGAARDSSGAVLPGVTVEVTSDALQGARSTVTDLNGNYEILGLPNGRYEVSFNLESFAEVSNAVVVPLGGTVEANVSMQIGTVSETVDVVGVVPTPLSTTEISQNITSDEVQALPLGRDPFQIAELAPGLTTNTQNGGQFTIGGSFGYDNVILVDGVDIIDNVFADAENLFIEDAIEESQILTSGISAEYGRFSGGVINVVTKSGGNAFSGSFRANLNKPDWVEETPFEKAQGNERTGALADNSTYETTLGGPLLRDRLWFFYANRFENVSEDETLPVTGLAFERALENRRNQIKLTGTVSPGHTLEGSYLRNSTSETNVPFSFSIDPAAVVTERTPNDLWVATYRGAATSSLFLEGQVSRKRFGFRDQGGTSTDIRDSPFINPFRLGHYSAPFFDSTDPEDRDNRQVTGSATYFLSTDQGSHSIKGGFEHFQSSVTGGNSQSSTGFVFLADYVVDANGVPEVDAQGRLMPIFQPFGALYFNFFAQRGASVDVNTLSFYVNDNWQVNDHLSFNLGVRSETVSSSTADNVGEFDAGTVVPRLGVAYDPFGDGRFTLQSTYSHYSGKYTELQFSQSTNVLRPDEVDRLYTGPPGQGLDFAPGFDLDNYTITTFSDFPARNIRVDDDLQSPLTKELTVSAGGQLGASGYAKVTYINRRASDFIEDFFTLDGGTTQIVQDGVDFGAVTNRQIRNTDLLSRDYDAIEVQARYQVTSSFLVDGTYTGQIKNDGNFEGETRNRPSIASNAFDFPEITPAARYFPTGRLDEFQRHKLRLWGIYNLGLGRYGHVDVGGLWRVNSGLAYSLQSTGTGTFPAQQAVLDAAGYVSGPEPTSRNIFYADGRGSETFEGYGLFDLSVNYDIPIWESLSPWFKVEIFNLSNNDKQIAFDTTVQPDESGPVDALGIPTTFVEGASFGQATSPNHFPQYLPGVSGLRAFQLAFGVRF